MLHTNIIHLESLVFYSNNNYSSQSSETILVISVEFMYYQYVITVFMPMRPHKTYLPKYRKAIGHTTSKYVHWKYQQVSSEIIKPERLRNKIDRPIYIFLYTLKCLYFTLLETSEQHTYNVFNIIMNNCIFWFMDFRMIRCIKIHISFVSLLQG